jgi:hypothetical protein
MALRLSEILEHDAPHLAITGRKQLLAFYDAIKAALKEGRLTPEGGALPTSLNELLTLLPGEQTPLKRDRELTDWAVDNDLKYAAFLDAWRARQVPTSRTPKPRAIAAPLYQAVMRLQALQAGGAKKAEFGAAVEVFLDVYALSQHALRLPRIDRTLPAGLPEGIELDERKVTLGSDTRGTYVGLVQRPEKNAEQAPASP